MSLREDLIARSSERRREPLSMSDWPGAFVCSLTVEERIRYEELAEAGEGLSEEERRLRRVAFLLMLAVVQADGTPVFRQPTREAPAGDLELIRKLPYEMVAPVYDVAAKACGLAKKDADAVPNSEGGPCAASSSSSPEP